MIIIRKKMYSGNAVLNTNAPGLGFTKGRKYDMDLDRLGRMSTAQRELGRIGDLRTEQRKMASELRGGIDLKD